MAEKSKFVFRAVPRFWESFNGLAPAEKQKVEAAFAIFKENPFDSRLNTHKINRLSSLRRKTIRSVTIEGNLRAVFEMDGNIITTIDVGTHDIYK